MLWLIAIAVIILFAVLLSAKPKRTNSSFIIGGRVYPYTIGDDLVRFNREVRNKGIEIDLPVELPHLYFDSRAKRDVVGTYYYFEDSQKLSLEGNFDKCFTLYAPKGHARLTLSIVTPDFMQTLIGVAKDYDVEIYKKHLRLIAAKKINNHPVRKEALKQAAKAVLLEIDHRLKSWNAENSDESKKSTLVMSDDQLLVELPSAFRSAKVRESIKLALVGCISLASVFYIPAIFLEENPSKHTQLWLLKAAAYLSFPTGFLIWTYVIIIKAQKAEK